MYTADEIQAAVSKLVQTTVSTPTDPLGVRRSDVTFSNLQEAAAGVFVLFADAPFYVAHLAARRIAEQVQTAQGTLDALLVASQALGRLVTPIEDLTGLGNAKVALGDLGNAVAGRTSGFRDISKVSAFRRYMAGLNSFIDSYGSNVKAGGDIVDTPQSARSKLAGLYNDLVAQYAEIIRTVQLLHDAIEDFEALHLPQVVANGVIGRAQGVLDDYIGTLGDQTPEERLEGLRALMLDLLTQQTVVEQYGSALGPSSYLDVLGPLTPYSDDTHPATPARLPARIPGPYITVTGQDSIEMAFDGSTTYSTIQIPQGAVAELDGQTSETFGIDSANNQIKYGTEVFETSSFGLAVLPSGPTETVDDIIAAVPALPELVLEPYLRPLKIDTLWNTTAPNTFTAVITPFVADKFGIRVGDRVEILDGPDAGTVWTVDATLFILNGFTVTGAGTLSTATNVRARVGAAARALRWSLPDKVEALTNRRGIALPADTPVQQAGHTVMGFFPEMRARSTPIRARDIVAYATPLYQAPQVEVDQLVQFSGLGRSLPNDAGRVQYYAGSYTGDIDGTTPNQITITNIFILEGREPRVADRVVLRGGPDNGTVWTITAVTSTGTVTATGSTTATTTADIGFDGAPFLSPNFGWYLTILDGPNAGSYEIPDPPGRSVIPNAATPDLLTIAVSRPLPVARQGTGGATFSLELAQEVPVFVSPSRTVESEVRVRDGVLARLLFGPIPPP